MIFKMQTMQRRWYQHLSYAAMGAGSGERGFLRFIESWERGQIFDKHRRCGFDVDSMYVLDVWWCFGCLEAEQNSKTLAVSWVLVMPVMPVMPLKLAWCGLLTARFSRPVWWKWFAWRQGWCRGNGWSYPQSTSRAFSEWLDMDPNMVRYLEVTTFHPISIDFPKLQRCFFFPSTMWHVQKVLPYPQFDQLRLQATEACGWSFILHPNVMVWVKTLVPVPNWYLKIERITWWMDLYFPVIW